MANQNRKPRGKKFNKKESDELEVEQRNKGSMNDPSWYALNPQLLADTSSIPYAWATGLRWLMNTKYGDIGNKTTPGLMAASIDLDPMTLNDAIDPVNVASREIVGAIRSYNSGAKNYDAPDLMIRILAEGSFISMLNWAIRLYATVNLYSSVNKYLPKDLLYIQGVDPDNFREHLADYRAALNNVIAKAAAVIYVPKSLHLFDRWSWLFKNYYMDSNSPKDQLYLLMPDSFYYFTIDEDTSMGMLQHTNWNSLVKEDNEYLEWDDVIEGLETMLNPLVEDQELCIMTGDMIKAYGPNTWSFSLIPENIIAVPVYDYIVLEQFKNLRTAVPSDPMAVGFDNSNIKQDADGTYLCHPSARREVQDFIAFVGNPSEATYDDATKATGLGKAIVELHHSDHILDTLSNSPTPVLNMENSRLITMVTDVESSDGVTEFRLTSGSEKVVNFKIGYRAYLPAYGNYAFRVATLHTANIVIETNLSVTGDTEITPVDSNWEDFVFQRVDARDLRSMLTNFDFAPATYWVDLIAVVDGDKRYVLFQDPGDFSVPQMRMSNIAFLGFAMAEKMNNCALLSEMNITGVTSKSSRRNKDGGK